MDGGHVSPHSCGPRTFVPAFSRRHARAALGRVPRRWTGADGTRPPARYFFDWEAKEIALDYYRHGGDSLQGRYHHLRLHPLSVAELSVTDSDGLRRLLDLGGFPEPWLTFGAPKVRAIKKAQKHYHYDWVQVYDTAARFENLVAMHLLKWVHREQDIRGRDVDLRYFRDVDGREGDFVLTDRPGPTHLIEVKWSDRPVDKALRYLHARFPDAAAIQISATGTDDYRTPDGIRVQPALPFLQSFV